MTDTSHLIALMTGLSHERERLAAAKSEEERKMRSVWVSQYEKQIEDEYVFLGMGQSVNFDISDDDLLADLAGQ